MKHHQNKNVAMWPTRLFSRFDEFSGCLPSARVAGGYCVRGEGVQAFTSLARAFAKVEG